MAGGVFAGSRVHSGSVLNISARISPIVSPWNIARAVSISYRTHPNAQMSEVRSMVLPRACSGDMYAAVPKITPGTEALIRVGELDNMVVCGFSNAFANPKSNTFTFPPSASLIFAGFSRDERFLFRTRLPTLPRSVSQSVKLHRLQLAPVSIVPAESRPAQFHHDAARLIGFFNSVDLRNIRVVQRGEHLRFTLES